MTSEWAILVNEEIIPVTQIPGWWDRNDKLISQEWVWESSLRWARFKRPRKLWVSTVFLCLNHGFGDEPNQWFETMIFYNGSDIYCGRYSTLAQAKAGHEEIKSKIRNGSIGRHDAYYG